MRSAAAPENRTGVPAGDAESSLGVASAKEEVRLLMLPGALSDSWSGAAAGRGRGGEGGGDSGLDSSRWMSSMRLLAVPNHSRNASFPCQHSTPDITSASPDAGQTAAWPTHGCRGGTRVVQATHSLAHRCITQAVSEHVASLGQQTAAARCSSGGGDGEWPHTQRPPQDGAG